MTITDQNWIPIALAAAAVLVALLAWLFPNQKSALFHWKGWAIITKWYRSAKKGYRINAAKNIMLTKLKQTGLTIPSGTYENCLVENRHTSERNTLSPITPEKPAWLNDFYVASALEALSREGKVVKAKKFGLNSFPPSPVQYLFRTTQVGTNAKQQANEIETESMCLVHQSFRMCLEAPRYEICGHAETTAPGITQFPTLSRLREDAPPCSRCWEVEEHRRHIRLLVDDITRYDLAATATSEITGTDREFQEAVIGICIERQCVAEVATVKKIVERAIEIRGSQLCHLATDHKMYWTEELTKEFTACLHEYIKTEVQ